MTLYPKDIDNNTSLPPSYTQDNTSSYKFVAEIGPSDTVKLTLPRSGSGLVLFGETSCLIKINCMIFNLDDLSSTSQYSQYIININTYCDEFGAVTYTVTSIELSNNPSGKYTVTFNTAFCELIINITNTSTTNAKAVAIIDYVSL